MVMTEPMGKLITCISHFFITTYLEETPYRERGLVWSEDSVTSRRKLMVAEVASPVAVGTRRNPPHILVHRKPRTQNHNQILTSRPASNNPFRANP